MTVSRTTTYIYASSSPSAVFVKFFNVFPQRIVVVANNNNIISVLTRSAIHYRNVPVRELHTHTQSDRPMEFFDFFLTLYHMIRFTVPPGCFTTNIPSISLAIILYYYYYFYIINIVE